MCLGNATNTCAFAFGSCFTAACLPTQLTLIVLYSFRTSMAQEIRFNHFGIPYVVRHNGFVSETDTHDTIIFRSNSLTLAFVQMAPSRGHTRLLSFLFYRGWIATPQIRPAHRRLRNHFTPLDPVPAPGHIRLADALLHRPNLFRPGVIYPLMNPHRRQRYLLRKLRNPGAASTSSLLIHSRLRKLRLHIPLDRNQSEGNQP